MMVAKDPSDDKPRTVVELTDPVALRALAHPIRLKLVGLLRTEGPLTATRAATLLGESSGSTSFHLRQLAKYGLVEETGGGQGRQKPWRATAWFTSWPNMAEAPEAASAIQELTSSVAQRYLERFNHWLRRSQHESAEWQAITGIGDAIVYLTAEELAEFGRKFDELLVGYRDRIEQRELRPAGSRPINIIHMLLPIESPAGPGE
jgi:predicted transcriptional regulator